MFSDAGIRQIITFLMQGSRVKKSFPKEGSEALIDRLSECLGVVTRTKIRHLKMIVCY